MPDNGVGTLPGWATPGKTGNLTPFVPQSVIPTTVNPLDPQGVAELARALLGSIAPQSAAAADITKRLLDPSSWYDPKADFAAAAQQQAIGDKLPTPFDNAAREAGIQTEGATYLDDKLRGIQAPQEGQIPQPNFPQLGLPNQPQTARPQVSPLAQILAIGAGFARPQAAGQFNAAALDGAIKGAEEENQRRQQIYKNDIAARSIVYDAAMGQAKEKQRIAEANIDAASHNSVAEFNREMMLAKSSSERFTAGLTSQSLVDFADEHDPQLKALERAKAIYANIDRKGTLAAEDRKGLIEILGAIDKGNAPGVKAAGDTFKAVLDALQQKMTLDATTKRAITIAGMQEKSAAAISENVQKHEDARATQSQKASMQRMLAEQNKINERFTKNLSSSKIPQTLKESQENQGRLQSVLKAAEESLTGARTDLDTIKGGGTLAGMSKGNGGLLVYNNRLDSAQLNLDAVRKALETEQKRGVRLDPNRGARGTFDPATGDFNIE